MTIHTGHLAPNQFPQDVSAASQQAEERHSPSHRSIRAWQRHKTTKVSARIRKDPPTSGIICGGPYFWPYYLLQSKTDFRVWVVHLAPKQKGGRHLHLSFLNCGPPCWLVPWDLASQLFPLEQKEGIEDSSQARWQRRQSKKKIH